MIRCGIVKMGERLKDIVEAKGVVEWQRKRQSIGRGNYMDSMWTSREGL